MRPEIIFREFLRTPLAPGQHLQIAVDRCVLDEVFPHPEPPGRDAVAGAVRAATAGFVPAMPAVGTSQADQLAAFAREHFFEVIREWNRVSQTEDIIFRRRCP